MKIYNILMIIVFAMTLFLVQAMGQQPRRNSNNNNQNNASTLSVRAQWQLSAPIQDFSQSKWQRIIYRQVDLNKEPNTALYYPEEPTEGESNLLRLMLRLLAENKITAYEYLDGREVFTDEFKLKVKDLFDRFYIPYQEKAGATNRLNQLTILENDIPSNEILSYYVKERWVYDEQSSQVKTYIEAICPILHRTGDFGGEPIKYPMFWMPYNNIRSYMTGHFIMTSNYNNARQYTFDDFFRMRMYKGDIYKTSNLRNYSLMQLYPSDSALTKARNEIEKQLTEFNKVLWAKPLVTDKEAPVVAQKKTEPVAKPTSRVSRQSTPKGSSVRSQAAPVRSVRRN